MKSVKSITEGETLALIKSYGEKISFAGGGIGGTARSDLIRWAERVAALARTMPSKNGLYLSDD